MGVYFEYIFLLESIAEPCIFIVNVVKGGI